MDSKAVIPERVTHLYDITRALKTVSYYKFHESQPKYTLLTKVIKLCRDASFYQITGNLYRLLLDQEKKWNKNPVYLKPIFKGKLLKCSGTIIMDDTPCLLVAQFNGNYSQVIIDVFPGYLPASEAELHEILRRININN